MTGIQFITDTKGRKTAAVIDLKKHSALWEDIEDVLVSRSRRHEKRIPLEKVKAGLEGTELLEPEVQSPNTRSSSNSDERSNRHAPVAAIVL
jgi:hypothetical protein